MNTLLYVYPSLITWLALALYFFTLFLVGRARGKYQVSPPLTTGPDAFNRIFRVQQNTTEQLVLFLPALWLFALFVSHVWAAVLGLVWLIGRVVYIVSYSKDAGKRLPGFILAMVATVILLIGALIGVIGAFTAL